MPEDARAAFIAEAAGDDAELRRAVEEQLKQDRVGHGPLDGSTARDALERALGDAMRDDERQMLADAPVSIGGYRVTRTIGEGGMGTVFEAEQDQPRRMVAVKVLRAGAMGEGSSQRLAREAELHGRLSHPGIAQVYEAGVAEVRTASGRTGREAFVAMELVSGLPVLEYVRQASPDVRERVEFMAHVCEAVAHAHGRGVVHLDIKPANILAVRDGATDIWRPKVLDFGVARALHADGTPATLMTVERRVMGTISYMSPERIAGAEGAISPQADVYSLGATLFEVLAGRPAHDGRGLAAGESLRQRLEGEQARLGDVERSCRGPLEAIVEKAMANDRARRYASAEAMAADLRRYLAGEPVSARRANQVERAMQFVGRHRVEAWFALAFIVLLTGSFFAGLAAVLAVFVAASALCLWLFLRARREQRRAERGEASAMTEQRKVAAVMTFFQDMLATADPAIVPGGRHMTVLDLLNHTAKGLDAGGLATQPQVEVPVRTTVARAYLSLGRLDEAERQLRAAAGAGRIAYPLGHEDLAQVYNKLGRIMADRGRNADAIAFYRESLAMYRSLLGDEHERVVTLMNNLGLALGEHGRLDEAHEMLEQTLTLRRRLVGPVSSEEASTLNNLAVVFGRLGDPRRQVALFRESLAMDVAARKADHPNVAATMANLAHTLAILGEIEEAERLMRQSQAMRDRVFGADHVVSAYFACKLGWIALQAGRVEEAVRRIREGLARIERAVGPGHVFEAISRADLGEALIAAEQPEQAQVELARARELTLSLHGPKHQLLVDILERLSRARLRGGDVHGAQDAARDALRTAEITMPTTHWKAGVAKAALAMALRQSGDEKQAAALFDDAVHSCEPVLGDGHPLIRRWRAMHPAAPDQAPRSA